MYNRANPFTFVGGPNPFRTEITDALRTNLDNFRNIVRIEMEVNDPEADDFCNRFIFYPFAACTELVIENIDNLPVLNAVEVRPESPALAKLIATLMTAYCISIMPREFTEAAHEGWGIVLAMYHTYFERFESPDLVAFRESMEDQARLSSEECNVLLLMFMAPSYISPEHQRIRDATIPRIFGLFLQGSALHQKLGMVLSKITEKWMIQSGSD
ncbi:hypothetical protein HT749_31940 [Burkholderia cepacia]|uniref:hypothetical protein n=1 Tax=Burkholderia cepacia complex TaxID=87882 RepID=UPI00157B2FFB|nr:MULTISPECIES: hypothetical protein [Burkholderia cepacia complex]MBR8218291.1 hypothetical protein [Burkholderia vietnamiensis]NTX48003.1 hypothetical protein [Burkholderia cepacia]